MVALSGIILVAALGWWATSAKPEAEANPIASAEGSSIPLPNTIRTSASIPTSEGIERTSYPIQPSAPNKPFRILEAFPQTDGSVSYHIRPMDGVEVTTPAGDARRSVPAMDQRDYPEPESGCGPAAMLNWFLWWQSQGLLRSPLQGAESGVLARHDFQAIEREIFGLRGIDRAKLRGGTNALEIICAMDRLASQWSNGAIRMHYRQFDAPLKVADLLEFTKGQRSGILITRVVQADGSLGGYHAVSLVAGDRAGYLMINNWGERVYGSLRNEGRGQIFYPKNVAHPALKVENALCFIPFRPTKNTEIADLDAGTFQRSGRTSIRTIPRPRSTPQVSTSQATTQNEFNIAFRFEKNGGYIYRITNQGETTAAVFLKTFQGVIAPGAKPQYPTDLQPADRVTGGSMSYGSIAELVIPAKGYRDLWFEFDYLEATNGYPPTLIQVH